MTQIIRLKELSKIMSESCDSYHGYEFLDMLEIFKNTIEELVLQGNEVILHDFGSFKPKYSKGKKLYSGLNDNWTEVPPAMTMMFSPSRSFQKRIREKYLKTKGELKHE